MKAYQVHTRDYENGVVVFAKTAGKARALGHAELDEEFLAVEVRRAPEFDTLSPGPVTPEQYLERDWHIPCHGERCSKTLWDEDGDAVFGPKGDPYCSDACQVAGEVFWAEQRRIREAHEAEFEARRAAL